MSDSEYEYSDSDSEEEDDNETPQDQMQAIRRQRARQFEEQRTRQEAKTPEYRQFVRASSSGQTLGDSNSKVNITLSDDDERAIEQEVIDEFWRDSTNHGRWHNLKFANLQVAHQLIASEERNNPNEPRVILMKKQDVKFLQAKFDDRKRERLEHMKEQAKIQRVAMAKRKLDRLDVRDPAYRHKARRLNDIIQGKAYHKNTTLIF